MIDVAIFTLLADFMYITIFSFSKELSSSQSNIQYILKTLPLCLSITPNATAGKLSGM
jgi:hypothetical protein